MKIVGITGGIGAGKSVVSRVLRSRGYEVYDCDYEAGLLMDASVELRSALRERLGEACVMPDGSLCRAEIARHVFTDESHREWLNSIVHEMVRNDLEERMAGSQATLFFIESAILHTSGLDRMCSRVWLVDAPEEVRLSRACDRDSTNSESIRARMCAQNGEFSDFGQIPVDRVINDGELPLIPQIDNYLNIIENI